MNIFFIKSNEYDPVIPLMDILYPKDLKARIQTNIYTPIFIAALSTIARKWKQPNCPLTSE